MESHTATTESPSGDSPLAGAWTPIEALSRAYYDGIAADYERQIDTADMHAMRECFWQRAEAMLPASARMLDFGAGTGIDADHFARLGHRVVAYDVSEGMLAVLRQRSAGLIAAGSIEPIWGSAAGARAALIERAPFDAVLCNFAVFSMVPHPEALFRLFGALVRRGGFALVCIQNPWNREETCTRSFWRALLAKPRTRTIRYCSGQSGFSYRHTPGEIRRAARPEFAPDRKPEPACCKRCFGPRSQMRLVALRRV